MERLAVNRRPAKRAAGSRRIWNRYAKTGRRSKDAAVASRALMGRMRQEGCQRKREALMFSHALPKKHTVFGQALTETEGRHAGLGGVLIRLVGRGVRRVSRPVNAVGGNACTVAQHERRWVQR